jgi:hypothetical protein
MAAAALVASPACAPSANEQPLCGHLSPLTLMAESVRSAVLVPCVSSLPAGWSFASFAADERHATFALEPDAAGTGLAEVALTRSCETEGLRRVPSDRSGVDEYASTSHDAGATWMFVFDGGCVRLHVPSTSSSTSSSIRPSDVHDAIAFVPADALGPSSDG